MPRVKEIKARKASESVRWRVESVASNILVIVWTINNIHVRQSYKVPLDADGEPISGSDAVRWLRGRAMGAVKRLDRKASQTSPRAVWFGKTGELEVSV
jgi:hypothetical protein